MTAQQLKNSILQMAVQGKLVPQDPNDEPASVLLERIRAEKEQLIKEKKIKKEKNPSVIFRGADNLPYEKVGKNEPVCIADEAPFEIPDSWEWVRLGSVIELQSGQDMTPDKYNDNGDGIPYITGASNIIDGTVVINRWTTCGKAFAHRGDILLTCKGTVGTMAILQEETVHIARQIMAIRPIGNLYVPYIQLVLETMVENLKAAAKSMIPGISRNDVLTSLFPVPPLNEQHRIIIKLKEVDPYICQYDKSESMLRHMDNIFPETLKKSILQWAVQGKLVAQDPNDEPVEVLLERIKAEKHRLVKEGKIKKDKHESVIFRRDNSHYEKLDGTEYCIDNELPFEIPENWCWVRLRSIVYNRGQATPNTAFCYIDIGSIDNKNQKLNAAETIIFPDKAPSRARKLVDKGDILYSTVRPYLHNMCIIDREFSQVPIASTGFAVLACHTGLLNKFLFYYMMSPDFDAYANNTDNAKGVAYPAISDARLYKALIPLPPFSEQQRIIQRIDELLPLVKGL